MVLNFLTGYTSPENASVACSLKKSLASSSIVGVLSFVCKRERSIAARSITLFPRAAGVQRAMCQFGLDWEWIKASVNVVS